MVIDTMVIVYALLGVEGFCEESAEVLGRADEIWVPDSIRAELASAVWQWVRHRDVLLETAIEALGDANRLFTDVAPVTMLWEHALQLAVATEISPYDTLFVALAMSSGRPVVTYDDQILRAFPDYSLTARQYLQTMS